MKMDGHDILVGDFVFDTVFNTGVVDRVIEGEKKFMVKFGNRIQTYDSKGNGNFGIRTLYWRDPVIVAPGKDDDTWAKTTQCAKAINAILRGVA
jgi:hypothetical protein